jgi:hypothetical protein
MAIKSDITLRESTERASSGTTIIVIGFTMAAVIIGISVILTLTSFLEVKKLHNNNNKAQDLG